MAIKVLQTNKKAYFNYEVVEDIECGIALLGSEVKSIRANRFSFGDSFVKITDKGLVLVSLHISKYKQSNMFNHEPERERALLAHKQEIKRLRRRVEEKGMTLVPTKIYLKENLVKVQISLCRGKRLHDKREAIKARDNKRSLDREMREFNR
ncbi:MAG: SsrA-binding protein SmpB [Sphaerochaetaceae bacterium]|nr:SsrA-binding protein SmpB [Sphaerochaetaceae bacterium]HHU88408.1 SsrA-binding protein SmpB [Spirochaetales bacterium]